MTTPTTPLSRAELIKKRTQNPEYEIFWRDLREAFHEVERNENGTRQATVEKMGYKGTIATAGDSILIAIEFVEPDPPTLIVPS